MDLYTIIYSFLFVLIGSQAAAYDHLDPTGNITIKWDVMAWTPDGYVAVVTMTNYQKYREVKKPGWKLGWTWTRKEVIWSMVGSQATDQGDCSKFRGNIPHSCMKQPVIVDLMYGVPYNQQVANCCKNGVLSSWGRNPSKAVSAFQLSVGLAGTTNKTVRLPMNFTLLAPGFRYTCGPPKIVKPTVFVTPGRRKTQAFRAFDPLDPNGNITIKWDIMSWTPDGYVAVVAIANFQMYRHITSPGWTIGWTWAKKEVIWSMVGAEATDQGDCSKFKGNIPHCCKRNPAIVDLLPGAPYNQQISNCCKGGVISSFGQDPSTSASDFQLSVGLSGTSNKTVRLPKNFTLLGPGRGYTCSQATVVRPSVFLSSDGRRETQAMMTWNVTCTYSQMLASPNPTCCLSMSSFYNSTITPCPACSCGCQNKNNCVASESNILSVTNDNNPLLLCTQHMCPVRVHWHVKLNYRDYWRVKITITNFNFLVNYTQWTLVVQHPNLNNLTQVFSFDYIPLIPYPSTNDSGMFYGIKFYNDLLMEAGPDGNVQTELLLKKDLNTFTYNEGWAFPRKVYFNGDECQMPLPDKYPFLPNSAPLNLLALSNLVLALLLVVSLGL